MRDTVFAARVLEQRDPIRTREGGEGLWRDFAMDDLRQLINRNRRCGRRENAAEMLCNLVLRCGLRDRRAERQPGITRRQRLCLYGAFDQPRAFEGGGWSTGDIKR